MARLNALFDLDGTLTDPGDGFVRCVRHALGTLDCLAHSDLEIRRHVGPPLQQTLRTLLGGRADKLDAAIALYRERYAREGYLENQVYPGVPEMLTSLKERNIALFVATSKPLPFAQQILEHFRLGAFFKGIYGSDLDGTRSDKANLIAHVVEVEQLDKAATTMIGDRAEDVLGAVRNDVRPVGALWGYGSREELSRAGAKAFCERPMDLRSTLT